VSGRAIIAIWTLALASLAGAGALVLTSNYLDRKVALTVLALGVPLTYFASGLVGWTRRPGSRIGLLLVCIGFAWLVAALPAANWSVPFTVGLALQALFLAVITHLVLAFPSGRLEDALDRTIVIAVYALVLVGRPITLLFEEVAPECDGDPCPTNLLAVATSDIPGLIYTVLAVGAVAAVAARLGWRWHAASPALRHGLAPVLVAAAVLILILVAQATAGRLSGNAAETMYWARHVAPLALPLGFLFGLLRTRLGGAVDRLVLELGSAPQPGELRDALARAVGDPSLELAYCVEDGSFVDLAGRPATLPPPGSGRVATFAERDGRRIAALIHDESLQQDPALGTVAAAAALALENERLQAELRARLSDLAALADEQAASRARIVEAGDAERRRLERNLHDGAQQRLVSLSLALRLARARLASDPEAAAATMNEAAAELARALEELRELARGIHPAVLAEHGLAPALESLAARASLSVELAPLPEERLPNAVEAAAYYLIAEALTNAERYAHATRATVSVSRTNGTAVVRVADDGIGGADPERGTGLRALADRVETLAGRLVIDSPPGQGTTITAEIPCA
jgi:signal transduction histidine kinase